MYVKFFFKAEKEHQVRSDDFGRDLSTVQLLLTKQDAFDAGLNAFEHEGIQRITELKDQLIQAKHQQTLNIEKRHNDVMVRWQQLLVRKTLLFIIIIKNIPLIKKNQIIR